MDPFTATIGLIISGISLLTGFISASNELARSDRMANLDAVNIEADAQKEKNSYEASAAQAGMDATANTSLAAEAMADAAIATTQGEQLAEQRRVEGALVSGSQQALLAATGQIGTGSATSLAEETTSNTTKDMDIITGNAAANSAKLEERAEGYTSLATSYSTQQGLDQAYADSINPAQEKEDYINAYFGTVTPVTEAETEPMELPPNVGLIPNGGIY